MRIQLVANPASGTHSPALLARLHRALVARGAEVTDGESSPQQPLHLDAQAQRLVVVGGDGTLRHVAAAIHASGRHLPLMAYPGGTVNLAQREMQAPLDPDAFAVLATGAQPPVEHYAAKLNETLFLVCASVGPDSAAVAGLSATLKRHLGRLAYLVAFLAVLWRWSLPRLRVNIDGAAHDCTAIYVAKGRYFAGPWSFAPQACMTSPELHVVCVDAPTRWRYLGFLLALLLRRPLAGMSGVCCLRCREVQIAASDGQALPVQADGDIAATLPATIAVDPVPLQVLRIS